MFPQFHGMTRRKSQRVDAKDWSNAQIRKPTRMESNETLFFMICRRLSRMRSQPVLWYHTRARKNWRKLFRDTGYTLVTFCTTQIKGYSVVYNCLKSAPTASLEDFFPVRRTHIPIECSGHLRTNPSFGSPSHNNIFQQPLFLCLTPTLLVSLH